MERLRTFRFLKQRKSQYEEYVRMLDEEHSDNPGSNKRMVMCQSVVDELEWIMERIAENDYELEDFVKDYRPSDFRAELEAKPDEPQSSGEVEAE